jgi:hypothetical protein
LPRLVPDLPLRRLATRFSVVSVDLPALLNVGGGQCLDQKERRKGTYGELLVNKWSSLRPTKLFLPKVAGERFASFDVSDVVAAA